MIARSSVVPPVVVCAFLSASSVSHCGVISYDYQSAYQYIVESGGAYGPAPSGPHDTRNVPAEKEDPNAPFDLTNADQGYHIVWAKDDTSWSMVSRSLIRTNTVLKHTSGSKTTHSLGLTLTSSAQFLGGDPFYAGGHPAAGSAAVSYFDTAFLEYKQLGTAPPILGEKLRYEFHSHFVISAAGGASYASVGLKVFPLDAPIELGTIPGVDAVYEYFADSPMYMTIDPSFGVSTTIRELDGKPVTQHGILVGVGLSFEGTGSVGFDGQNTFSLTRIVFEGGPYDGMTPEELGFDLVFASGTNSPNTVVPEPSTFVIWSLLGTAFGFHTWRRRRRQ